MVEMNKTTRVYGLDLLRAIAILSVLLYHYPSTHEQLFLRKVSHFGWMGVDLFFVLSGFLIGGQLFNEIKKSGSLDFRRFYIRRFFRTLPSYYITLAISILIAWPLSKAVTTNLWSYLFFLQNFNSPVLFTTSWSLCVEEHFYLFFPFITYLAFRTSKYFYPKLIFAFIFLAGLLFRYYVWQKLRPDLLYQQNADAGFEALINNILCPSYQRMDGLTVGVGIAAIKVFKNEIWQSWLKSSKMFLSFSILLIGLSLMLFMQRFGLMANVFGFPLLSFGFGALLISVVSTESFLTRFKIPGVETIAILAYAIYLTHFFAISLAEKAMVVLGFENHGVALTVAIIVFVPALAAVMYYGVEKYFLSLRDRVKKT
jgi:peptidoglycan/LPS O-acetylase OafA/YrhL